MASSLKFSHHARVRQNERDIDFISVDVAKNHGVQETCTNSEVFTDSDVKAIFAKDENKVITVMENKRNTMFQLSKYSKDKEEHLIGKLKRNGRNTSAMCDLADFYLDGKLGIQDVRKAYDLFERAAKLGNSHAMCKLSQIHEVDDYGMKNEELFEFWLRKAADKGNSFACAYLGQKLLAKYCEKYPKDSSKFKPSAPKKEIMHYLGKAADKGATRAIWTIATIYEEGLFDKKDLSKAIEIYVKAAISGSPSSIDALQRLTLESRFSAQELEDILDQVEPKLCTASIGMAYQIGCDQLFEGLGNNRCRGLRMIEQAALKGYNEAIKTLAKCYRNGIGCDVDLKLAQYWYLKLHDLYRKTAEAGNFKSQWELGKFYLKGYIGDIELDKAETSFKECVDKTCNPDWMIYLGNLYLNGRLGDRSPETGVELINQALNIWACKAKEGDNSACEKLADFYQLINSDKNVVYWLSKIPEKDNVLQMQLAEIYLNDSSSEKNIPLGIQILESIYESRKPVEFGSTTNKHLMAWLEDKVKNGKESGFEKHPEFYKDALKMLGRIITLDEDGANDERSSKYFYWLFTDFKCSTAGIKLLEYYIEKRLPIEYNETIKNWAMQLPKLLETWETDDSGLFFQCCVMIGKLHATGDLLRYDVKEAFKWLQVALQVASSPSGKEKILNDLKILPELDSNAKYQILQELADFSKQIKCKSPLIYKMMSRILGDLFNENTFKERSIDDAIYWYEESSLLNNSKASFALGKLYHFDKGDSDKAIEWYMISSLQGNNFALKELESMLDKDNSLNSVSSFLNRFKHKSLIQESKLANINPLKNLNVYPTTAQEMYDLGKDYLNSDDEKYINVLNSAFWFSKAMKRKNIDAAIELCSLYKSGSLGNSLINISDSFIFEILKICCSALRQEIISIKTRKNIMEERIQKVSEMLDKIFKLMEVANIVLPPLLSESREKISIGSKNLEVFEEILSGLRILYLQYSNSLTSKFTVK